MLRSCLNAGLPFPRWFIGRYVYVADMIQHDPQGRQQRSQLRNRDRRVGAAIHVQCQIVVGQNFQVFCSLLLQQVLQ